jgi:glyoxalase family protein
MAFKTRREVVAFMTNSGKSSGVFGIHHVTAIARNPQQNIDFDDPTTYHLYYGDYLGHPGTILTFFPWSEAPRGHRGTGQVTAVSFLVPAGSINYWTDRLKHNSISFIGPSKRLSDEFISFYDPDGLMVELVSPSNKSEELKDTYVWKESPVNPKFAIRGFHFATLSEEGYERTALLLTDILGCKLVDQDNKEDSAFRQQTKWKTNP